MAARSDWVEVKWKLKAPVVRGPPKRAAGGGGVPTKVARIGGASTGVPPVPPVQAEALHMMLCAWLRHRGVSPERELAIMGCELVAAHASDSGCVLATLLDVKVRARVHLMPPHVHVRVAW